MYLAKDSYLRLHCDCFCEAKYSKEHLCDKNQLIHCILCIYLTAKQSISSYFCLMTFCSHLSHLNLPSWIIQRHKLQIIDVFFVLKKEKSFNLLILLEVSSTLQCQVFHLSRLTSNHYHDPVQGHGSLLEPFPDLFGYRADLHPEQVTSASQSHIQTTTHAHTHSYGQFKNTR